MKVVILAGGKGSRLSELTKRIPKPMVKIGSKPIILRIMKHYYKYGFNDFIIATGYKGYIIKNYFRSKSFKYRWNVRCINTGINTMTGGRLRKLKKFLGDVFLFTYGDGMHNVNLSSLVNFHEKKKNIATLTAVRPPARFGGVKLIGNKVKFFREKSSLDEGWINGGFFVFSKKIFKYLKGNSTILESEPLEKICKLKKLGAFRHYGFWRCMDTIRDKEILDKIYKNK